MFSKKAIQNIEGLVWQNVHMSFFLSLFLNPIK